MSKINYEYKAKVLASGLCEIEKKISKTFYVNDMNKLYGMNIENSNTYSIEMANQLLEYYMEHCPNDLLEAKKINHATYERVKRLKNRIAKLLEKPCLFLTLTFTNESLSNTSAITRRRYVTRYLNNFNTEFVGNKDFGKKNGREHYHAVIQAEKIDYSLWQHGAIKGLRVRLDKNSTKERLSKYIAKLTNHAIKETTKRSALIYSRMKKVA